jgi:mono/diheme cytochrome c family protein
MTALAFLLALAFQEARPVVPGFERLKDPAEAGRLLLGELNCVTCHKAEGFNIKQAPVLTHAGDRLQADWVRAYLADPQKVKPGTTMPRANLTPEDIDVLTHFLATLTSGRPLILPGGPAPKTRDLYNSVGCAACHAPLEKPELAGSVPLPDLRAKYSSPAALAQFLLDPLSVRPSGRMPRLNLTGGEAAALAAHFIGLPPREADEPADARPGVAWDAYEGGFGKVPDFDGLKPYASGVSPRIDLKVARRDQNYALRFRGYLDVPADGTYTFTTASDDGSILRIGDQTVVDNDGIHGPQEVAGSVRLKKGRHAFSLGFIQGGGGDELKVAWEGPGVSRQDLPAKNLFHEPAGAPVVKAAAAASTAAFVPDAAKAALGKDLFVKKRCSSCHKAGDLKPLEFKPLAQINRQGCLVGAPNTGKFHLSEPMVDAIRAALDAVQGPAVAPAPALQVERTMAALNCYACHERGGKGGVGPDRYPWFTTTYEDTGDEGRVPPHLNGVGSKLRKEWLNTLLSTGQKVRPYMNTRMPVFGPAAVAGLADVLEAADAPAPSEPKPREASLVRAGRQLVGTNGLSCVQCHMFQNHKSLGIPGMDLVHMAARLRKDWFVRYLLDPPSLRPGTRMPTYWPEGRSVRKDVLGGDTALQIEALWQFLSEGGKAALPVGIGPQPILLVPQGEALMYRNFIQGAGARAIGVGLPERVHYAFDANEMRLALIWQGDFIDASKHWVDRGPGFQGPAGDAVVALPDGPPFAVLADVQAPWPPAKEGFGFVGYDLDAKRRPTLLYRWKDAAVKDLIEAAPGPALKRTISVSGAPPGAWFRAATGKRIEPAGPDAWKVDGSLTVVVEGAEPTLRSGSELRIPAGTGFSITYRW